MLAKRSYLGINQRSFSYYRNTKGSVVHLIDEAGQDISAMTILPEERVRYEKVVVYPWEALG